MRQEESNFHPNHRTWTRREVIRLAGVVLFLAACGENNTFSSPSPTSRQFGPYPETPTQVISQLTPDQFIQQEQQLYQSGKTIDVLLQDWRLIIDPTLGNAGLLEYIQGDEQGVSVNNIFRLSLQDLGQGSAIHGIVPKDSPAGQVLFSTPQRLPNIIAFEGPIVNVKILSFSDTDIYDNQGLALLSKI